MKLKKKLLYDVIGILTLSLPMLAYLILAATYLSVDVQYYITNEANNIQVEVLETDDRVYVYTNEEAPQYEGELKYEQEVQTLAFEVFNGQVIKINSKYRTPQLNEEKGTLELVDVKFLQMSEKQSWAIPLGVFIGIFGAFIITLIKLNKLKVLDKHRNFAVLVSLTIGTLVLYLIDLFVSNLIPIFLVATISWAVYMAEQGYFKSIDEDYKRTKKKDDILKQLNDALK